MIALYARTSVLLCVDRLPYPELVCIKVDFVVLSPSMFCYVTTGFTLFDVSFMFLFSRSESTAGFTYITPTTISAINFVYNVGLFLGKWSVLW